MVSLGLPQIKWLELRIKTAEISRRMTLGAKNNGPIRKQKDDVVDENKVENGAKHN